MNTTSERKRSGASLCLTALLSISPVLCPVMAEAEGDSVKVEADAGPTSEPVEPYLVADRIIVEGKRSYLGLSSSSATKTDTALIDIPQAISIVSRDLIDDQAMRSMADVLRYVPGASMGQGEGHRDAPTLRGNSSTADFFVDGVRDDAEYFRDLYTVERVEVIKGPSALIFGRGGGGGLVNRVTKKAEFESTREIELKGGQFGFGRGAVDVGGAVAENIALRFNGFYENADSYRDFVGTELLGLNPIGTLAFSDDTRLRLGYEHFSDDRTVDRGVPSFAGRPYAGDRNAFFGNPDQSYSEFERNAATASFEHDFSGDLSVRNHTSFAANDKFYSNVFASSSINSLGNVSLQSYRSSQQRRNLFNQTDFIWKTSTGPIAHQILLGAEIGVQGTENFRVPNNAFMTVNIADPTTFAPAPFTGVQTNNEVDNTVVGVYLQDQIAINDHIQLIGGLRFDRFSLDFDDLRPATADFERTDGVFSPRGGVILKPVKNASLYASYSRSFLPQSGDQFNSLTATLAALEPESFENIEFGVKWDMAPRLALTAAVYRLDRENTRAVDPLTLLTVLTGAQRSKGVEIGLAGAITDNWDVFAGYAYQDAEITRTTTAAPAGRNLPLVPQQSFSLWTSWRILPRLRLGGGVVHQSDRFTTLSNAVVMPDFTRIDAAIFYEFSDCLEMQVNIENIADELYFPTAHNDNNITPGAPRSVRAALTMRL
ncbi:MAG: TonB-dependent siderophore receptor [Parvularculaceae bacterium]